MSALLFLLRPRVEALLHTDRPLLVLAAPAGYGKTSAVRHAAVPPRTARAWVTLTSASPDIFWEKCCTAVSVFSPKLSEDLAALGPPVETRQMDRAAFILARHAALLAREGKRAQLVLDDFHHIDSNPLLCRLFSTLAFEEAAGLQMVLISRREPPLPLTTLCVKGLCSVVRMEDLAFQEEETRAFLHLRGEKPDDTLVRRMQELSAGWISALRLMPPQKIVSPVADISALLRENLLATLTPEEQHILRQCSQLETFTLEQAVTVLENSDAEPLLEHLLRQNAFISRDDQGVCRFHPLLQDMLLHECERVQLDAQGLRHRAACWLFEHGQVRESFLYFWRAGAVEEFLQRIDTPSGRNIPYGYLGIVQQITASLSVETICRHPFAALYIIFYLLLTGMPEECARAARLLKALRTHDAVRQHPEHERLQGECCLLAYFFLQGNTPAWACLEQAAALLHGQASLLLHQEDPFTMGLPGLLYQDYHSAGSLQATITSSCYSLFDTLCPGFGCGADTLLAAEAALQRGDMERAAQLAVTAGGQARQRRQWALVSGCCFVLARRALFLGDTAGMRHFLAEQHALEQEIRSTKYAPANWRVFMDVTELCAAWCDTGMEQPPCLPEILQEKTHRWMLGGRGWPDLLRARAAFREKRWERLLLLAEDCLTLCAGKYQLGVLHARILLAMALARTDSHDTALSVLECALTEAASDGVLLPFAEYAGAVLPLLAELKAPAPALAPFMAEVWKCCLRQQARHVSPAAPPKLTARELEVLRLAAQGLNRKEAAAALHVREDTIHKHLCAAYRKLGAGNKVAALNAARKQKLLSP